jgi:hypothetical protein
LSDKIYEWYLYNKNNLIRQGVICAKTKKEAELYLLNSASFDERKLFMQATLRIELIKK